MIIWSWRRFLPRHFLFAEPIGQFLLCFSFDFRGCIDVYGAYCPYQCGKIIAVTGDWDEIGDEVKWENDVYERPANFCFIGKRYIF